MAQIVPGLLPPPGFESDFENPNRNVQVWNIVAQSLCISLTSIFFLMRMYCRVLLQKTMGAEDCKLLSYFRSPFSFIVE